MKEIMETTEIEIGRLKALAEHLRKGKLYEKADRTQSLPSLSLHNSDGIIRHYDFPFLECPYLFKEWGFSKSGEAKLKDLSNANPATSAMTFFGLDGYTFQHLFCPYAQDCQIFGGRVLTRKATEKHVAHNINCFLEKVAILH